MSNTVSHIIASTASRADEWDAYDRLPKLVREMLQGAPIEFCAHTVERRCKFCIAHGRSAKLAEVQTACLIASSASAEIDLENEAYRARYGCDLPHVAARAAIQPYGRRAA